MKTRIKITLTIVGLLALAGVFYAANPSFFATVNSPVGIAATPGKLYVSDYLNQDIDTIDGAGNVSFFATIPDSVGNTEKYMAISPGLGTWAMGYLYVTQGDEVYKISPDGTSVTIFATLPADCGFDHTGITFDQVGTFGNDMIVTCNNGGVYRVNSIGNVTFVANVGTAIEGPAVAPAGFGPQGGQIWAADENNSLVHAIANDGTVTYGIVAWPGAEGVLVIPSNPCTFANSGAILVSAILNQNAIYQFSQSDLSGQSGNMVVTSETGSGIGLISFDGTQYSTSTFDNSIPGADYEGSAFVDCQSHPASPTPTATATATATATPTPTPTATATPCLNYDKYAFFGLKNVTISNAGGGAGAYNNPGVIGDVAIGGGTGTLEKTVINGRVFVDSSATPNIHPDCSVTGGVFSNQNLSADKTNVLNLSAQLAGFAPTQTFGNITANTTITRTAQLNVISVTSINLTKTNLTLSGNSSDVFIINVTSPTANFVLNGSKILVSGGLSANHVVVNFPGTGGTLSVYKASTTPVVSGTLLAPQRSIVIDNPPVTGSVIGSSVDVHSGGSVTGIQCQ